MTGDFEDIRIIVVPQPSDIIPSENANKEVVLSLNRHPPRLWQELFDISWERTLYYKKHQAYVSTGNLIVKCTLNELHSLVLTFIESAIVATNSEYRRLMSDQENKRSKSEREDRS